MSGPGQPKHQNSISRLTLTVNGEKRKFWLLQPTSLARLGHIPGITCKDMESTAPDIEPIPLIIVLHGSFMSSTQMMHASEFFDLADKHQCFIAYPDMSYIWQWDVPAGFANKDALFIEEMIQKLTALYPIDPKRIYATGFSSGADILHLLACSVSLSSRIAAFAPVCSNLDRTWAESCEHEWPTSIMLINGTHDKFNRWEGDSKRWMSVKETFQYWQEHNNITRTSEKLILPGSIVKARESNTRAHLTQSFDDATGSEVSLVTIEGGGHRWPGEQPDKLFARLVLGHKHKEKFAHSLIWKFFERHQLKSPRLKLLV